jgi:hypothetical protein
LWQYFSPLEADELIPAPKGVGPRAVRHFSCKATTSGVPPWGPWCRTWSPAADARGHGLRAELIGKVVPPLWQYFSREGQERRTSPFRTPKDTDPRTLWLFSPANWRVSGTLEGDRDRPFGPLMGRRCARGEGHAPVVAVLLREEKKVIRADGGPQRALDLDPCGSSC